MGIGENSYMTVGRTRIKVTLAGSLVYYFDAWVGDQSGQEAILGMDFMVPAGIRLDLADGTLCSPDEVRIHLSGRRPSYNSKVQMISANDQHVVIPVGDSTEVRISMGPTNAKLWVTRGLNWVPTVTSGPGRKRYLHITNLSDKEVILGHGVSLGMWMANDMIPRTPGYVSVGSRRYMEWQTLALEATVDRREELPEVDTGPLVDHPQYPTPTKILGRPRKDTEEKVTATAKIIYQSEEESSIDADLSKAQVAIATAKEIGEGDRESDRGNKSPIVDRELDRSDQTLIDTQIAVANTELPSGQLAPDDSVYYHESGDLFAEDGEQHLAVLPEVATSTEEVTMEDIQVGDPGIPLSEDQEALRQLIWKNRHFSSEKAMLYHRQPEVQFVILTWEEQIRSPKEYDLLLHSSERS